MALEMEAAFLDLDNTLIASGHTYFLPQLECATILVKEFGYLSPLPQKLITWAYEIQHSDMSDMHNRGKSLFAQSWVDLYKKLCEQHNRKPRATIGKALVERASKWFVETYEVYPGVREALETIKIPKYIVTLGHLDVQEYKIKNTNLDKYVQGVEIVTEKTKTTYVNLCEKYKLNPRRTVMIGDNLNLDIKPAIDAGMHGWHIQHDKDEKPFAEGHPWFKHFNSFQEAAENLKYDEKALCNSIS